MALRPSPSRTKVSTTGTRPIPSRAGTSFWVTMARRVLATCLPQSKVLIGWIKLEDALHRLLGVGGVQRAEDVVAGFRSGERGVEGFLIPHLSDEDDIRVLAKNRAHPRGKVGHIDTHLPLVKDAFEVGKVELNRVLQRNNVTIHRVVEVVHHRGERAALAGPCGPADEENPVIEKRYLRSWASGKKRKNDPLNFAVERCPGAVGVAIFIRGPFFLVHYGSKSN